MQSLDEEPEAHVEELAERVSRLRAIVGRTERALRAERDFVEGLLNAAPIIVLVLDGRGRIVRFNEHLRRLTGTRLEDVVGADFFDTFMPSQTREDARAIVQAPARERTPGAVHPIVTRDGKLREIEWSNADIAAPGVEAPSRLLMGRDVSDERRLERGAQHAQKMEAVGTLAAGIAHDFNNLLMAIAGMAEMAEGKLHERDAVAGYLAEIRRATKGGAAIVSQLLTFSKRGGTQRMDVAVDHAIDDGVQVLRTLLGEDVRLEIALNAKGARVLLAPGHLEQIVMNLAANARHAMPKGGTFRLETARVVLSAERVRQHQGLVPGRYVQLRVSDTGVGMDEETRARVFEPFFTTKDEVGTGLGLSSIYGIVRSADGQIAVESTKGEGTCFTILLPCTRPSQMRLCIPTHDVQHTHQAGTILVVEDEQLVRMTVCHYLKKGGYRVLEAASGEEALALCQEDSVDGILSDAVLPTMSGPELMNRVKESGMRIPVSLMSAHPREMLLEWDAAIDPETLTIQKPFSQEEALALAERMLSAPKQQRALLDVEAATPPVVLLVEDNPVARAAMVELLTEQGYEVLAAGTVQGALTLVESRGVDVVLSDVRLPDGTGPALVERLRESRPNVRAVYMSGVRDGETDAIVARQAAAFVQKPADFSALDTALKKQLAMG